MRNSDTYADVQAIVSITNSTFSGNFAGDDGGGIGNRNDSQLTISHSTITDNTAADDGGGIDNDANLTLTRSLLSGNSAADGNDVYNSDTIVVNNYNIFGTSSASGVTGFTPGATDIILTVALSSVLDSLTDNGGDTATHALVPGSPAIDTSPNDSNCEAIDQRGIIRPQGSACDIGAFELVSESETDGDGDGVTIEDGDCDDSDANVFPGAPEVCNDIDDNCDGSTDEGLGGNECDTGVPGECAIGIEMCLGGSLSCEQNILPDAELCDGLDNDCDGVTDNACSGGPLDTDGDGIPNDIDNCPDDQNVAQTDSDGDGVGDACDAFPDDANETSDADGDGVGDNSDAFPDDANETSDADGDGVGDNADLCPGTPDGEIVDADGCSDSQLNNVLLGYSPDITTDLSGQTVHHEDVAEEDLSGGVTLLDLGALPSEADVIASHQLPRGDLLLSFDIPVSLPGGLFVHTGDVVRFDGVTYVRVFDATANGLPPDTQTNAVGVAANGDLLLSFDLPLNLSGLNVDDEDVARFNGSSFSQFFDGSATGLTTDLDLDGFHLQATGELLLSFDSSGQVGGINFDDEDVLQFDPSGSTWSMHYDGSAQHLGWTAANMDALHAPLPPGDSDGDGVDDRVDNCPDDQNANQTDADSDGVGDVCDALPADPNETVDADGDGSGNNADQCPGTPTGEPVDANGCAPSQQVMDEDGDGVSVADGDCDDTNPDIFPGAAEVCNAIDDDCDSETDEGTGGSQCATGIPGICATGLDVCASGSLSCEQTVFPESEQCDGVDNDCDGLVDNACFGGPLDTDGDGVLNDDDICPDTPGGETADTDGCSDSQLNSVLLGYSPDITTDLSGQTVQHEDVAEESLSGAVSLLNLGALPSEVDVIASHQLPRGDLLLSFDIPVSLPGGLFVNTGDVVHYDGVTYVQAFAATANGLPPDTQTNAVGVADNGDLLLSFDLPLNLGGLNVDDEDVARFDGTSFSLFFDGSDVGLSTDLDLDGFHLQASGELLLSFGSSGQIGGINFDDEDVLQYDPSNTTWSMHYDGSAQHLGWTAANMDALHAPLPPGDADTDGVDDRVDNCPSDPNIDQTDADGDGIGDVCDALPADPNESVDADGDGSGNNTDQCPGTPTGEPVDEAGCAPSQQVMDVDGDGVTVGDGDCDDTNPNIFPGAVEVCNGIDDNCDSVADEGTGGNQCATGLLGLCASGLDVCASGSLSCEQTIFPDSELCDNQDNDCNGAVDEACSGGSLDTDGDGVLNDDDFCPDTPTGEPAVLFGCSDSQLGSLSAGYSVDITTDLSGQIVRHEDIVEEDLNNIITVLSLGTLPAAADVIASHRLPRGDHLFSFDIPVSLPGGLFVNTGDVVRYDGVTYVRVFDAAASGLPAGTETNAVGIATNGDLLLSFNLAVNLGGLNADDEDIVRFDGTSFSLFFDGSDVGLPSNLDLDGFHLQGANTLLLSFDTSGQIGNISFDDEDFLELDLTSTTWRLLFDGSLLHPGWTSSNMDALHLPLPPGDADIDGVDDRVDNCPSDPNIDQTDADGDGIGDVCDALPADPNESVDADGDGSGNNTDQCPGTPTDEPVDENGCAPSQQMMDGDGDGVTTADGDCDDTNPNIFPGAVEVCNGIDDNCDGESDNGLSDVGQTCTTGQPGMCSLGTTTCAAGSLTCAPTTPPAAEVCDGLDNDCDGVVDDGNPGGGATCDTGLFGECSTGTQVCTNGALACLQDVEPSDEVCDGVDNNCDGIIDVPPITTLETQLFASDGQVRDAFGSALAVDGTTAIVGAPDRDGTFGSEGAAYVLVHDGITWNEQAQLLVNEGANGKVGARVALHNDTALVGAVRRNRVRVFLRDGTTWSEQATLSPESGAGSSFFGTSLGLSHDTALVGDQDARNKINTRTGAAFVFVRDGTTWSQQAKLSPDDDGGRNNNFGRSLVVSGDTAVIGAPGNSNENGAAAGAVYVFVRDGTTWSQQAKLLASDGDNIDAFGSSIALFEDILVIGAPRNTNENGTRAGAVYVFMRTGDTWTEQAKLIASDGVGSDDFGLQVAIIDGTLAIATPRFRNSENQRVGAIYIFKRIGLSWIEQQKILASDASPNAAFAQNIALTNDTLLVGAGQHTNDNGDRAGTMYAYNLTPLLPEVCDGSDNDCDGAIDEHFGLDSSCSVGIGACENTGARVCTSEGGVECTATAGTPGLEVCNGIDDDCDGIVDNNLTDEAQSCASGLPGVCSTATTICLNGVLSCEALTQASDEICDGLDNDCDGAIDNGNPEGGTACNTGQLGVCSAGTTLCTNGGIVCEQDLQPSEEVCDGLDNNCDATVDELCAGGPLDVDSDGILNDTDFCPGTAAQEIVDDIGCSSDQLNAIALDYAPDITALLGGETVNDEDVAADDRSGFVTLVDIGLPPANTDVTAYHQFPNGDQLLSFDTTVSLAGGVTAGPADVVRFDGLTHTVEFDATANGIPNGVITDAVSIHSNGDLLLSFDTSLSLNGVTADDEDIVQFDGSTFSLFFDGSAADVSKALDLDGMHFEIGGQLLVSFDGSGIMNSVNFDDEDVLRHDPSTGSWELVYDGSSLHAGWPVADMNALFAPALFPDSDGDGLTDDEDNCVDIFNADQLDSNDDGYGDACTYDLAITRITAPGTVVLTIRQPTQKKTATVQIQNQGLFTEVIPNADTLAALLELTVEPLHTCPDTLSVALASSNRFPIVLRSKQRRTINYTVLFASDCTPAPERSSTRNPGQEDYRYIATIDRSGLDGNVDVDPIDDTCPRDVIAPFPPGPESRWEYRRQRLWQPESRRNFWC